MTVKADDSHEKQRIRGSIRGFAFIVFEGFFEMR